MKYKNISQIAKYKNGHSDSHSNGCTHDAFCSDCDCMCPLNHNEEKRKEYYIHEKQIYDNTYKYNNNVHQ